jgi:hypothetical protein
MCCLKKLDVNFEIIIFKGNVKLMLWFKIGCFEIAKVRVALRGKCYYGSYYYYYFYFQGFGLLNLQTVRSVGKGRRV